MSIIKSIAKIIGYVVSIILLLVCIALAIEGFYEPIPVLIILILCINVPIQIIKYKRNKVVSNQVDELIEHINETQELPTFSADNLILTYNEVCHFNENAKILQKFTNTYYSVDKVDSFFEDYRVHERNTAHYEKQKGKVFVTNKRIIYYSYNLQYIIPIEDILRITYGKRYTIIYTNRNTKLHLYIDQNKLFQTVINILIYGK